MILGVEVWYIQTVYIAVTYRSLNKNQGLSSHTQITENKVLNKDI